MRWGYKDGENIDDEKAKHMLEALKAKKQELRSSAEIVVIPSAKAVNGFEHQVMMDLYFKAPVLNKIVEEQVKQIESIDKKIEKIIADVSGGRQETELKKDFFPAVFTGVLTYGKSITMNSE